MSNRIHSATVRRSVRHSAHELRRSIEALEPRVLMAANAWKAAVAGDWSDPTKWSAGHVPTSSEDVSIAVAGSYIVTHNQGTTDSVKSLTISATSATLELIGGKVQVSGATSVSGGTLTLQGGGLLKGTLATSGTGKFTITGSGILDGVTIASDLPVASGTLFLYHTVTLNSGKKITTTDATVYLYDQPDGGASLLGSGEVVLGGVSGGNVYLYNGSGHNATIASTIKVHGFGTVYFYGGTNNSTIQADQNGKTLSVTGATWINKGTLSATNGGILTVSGTWSSPSPGAINENASTLNLAGAFDTIPLPTRTAGAINVTGTYDLKGSTLALTATTGPWNLQGGTIKNGTISQTSATLLNVVGSGTLDTMTIASDFTFSSATLFLYHANTLSTGKKLTDNDGTLYLYDQPTGGASLNGTGEVILAGASGGSVYFYNGSGHLATISTTIKIHGYGTVYFYAGTNNATITADVNSKTLTVTGATWSNKGTLSAINGGNMTVSGTWSSPSPGVLSENASTLTLSGTFSNIVLPTRTAGTILLNGVYDLANGTLALTPTTGSWNDQGGTVKNATLNFTGGATLSIVGSATFDHVTFAKDYTVTSGTMFLNHANTLATGKKIIVNDGTLYLYDTATGGASLGGTGEVVLGGASGGTVYFYNGSGHLATLASTILTHGYGTVYFYTGESNTGTIQADVSGKTLSASGSTWVNKGTLSAINGATLTVSGTWSSPSPGKTTETNSTINLSGTFTNITLPVRTGGTILMNGIYDLAGSTLALTATTGSWNFQGGTIKNGSLSLAGGANLAIIGSATLDKVTLASNYTVASTTLFLIHACSLASGVQLTANLGTIYLYDQADGGASLNGSGEVILAGATGSSFYLYNGSGHLASIGSGVRVHGFGTFYSYGSVNNGIVEADV
ncbi:MAG TPA: LEPR-XLL domain-containing protein, partial [Tepidisphaeraceae bacterium]|nr:LEPR-XLL domain-containing protein [Tepidisphaeraceae bacterium]